MTRSPRTYVGVAATIAFFAIGWWLLGPSQLGGPTSYAVLSGTSMEPHLERALSLAVEIGHPIYDCVYLALALHHETHVVTADRRFAAAAPAGGCDLIAVVQLAAAERDDVRVGSLDGVVLARLPLPYAIPAATAPRGRQR